MTCKVAHKNIIGHLEQTIPVNLHNDISEHLNSCSNCRSLYDNVKAAYKIMETKPVPEINPYFYTRFEQKLKNKIHSETIFTPRVVWSIQSVAATILIIVGISLGLVIGDNISSSTISMKNQNRTEILEAYASDYYLTSTGEESISALLTNE